LILFNWDVAETLTSSNKDSGKLIRQLVNTQLMSLSTAQQ